MNRWFAKPTPHKAIINKSLVILWGFTLAGCSGMAAEKPGPSINTLGTGGRPAIVIGDDTAVVATLWDGAEYGYVRIEAAEAAAQTPNAHPIAFAPQQIRTALQALQVQGQAGEPKPLFTEQGLDDIAAPIAMALARAQPDQDVTFAVTGKRGNRLLNLMGERLVTSGRLFYQDGQLNVIFGSLQGEYEDTLRATGILRGFIPGSRSGPVTRTRLHVLPAAATAYASAERQDWLRMTPAAWSDKPPKSAAATAPAGVPVAPVSAGSTAGQASLPSAPPQATAPVAPAVSKRNSSSRSDAAMESTPTAAAAADKMAGSEDVHYQQFEKRLKTLDKLRDQGMITEQEYQQKRRAILDEL